MKKIKMMADWIAEEVESAKCYAEKYIEYKAAGDSNWSGRFKQMASDELNHAAVIHELATKEIAAISKIFKAPEEMQEAWNKAHTGYVEKSAWVKMMLNM